MADDGKSDAENNDSAQLTTRASPGPGIQSSSKTGSAKSLQKTESAKSLNKPESAKSLNKPESAHSLQKAESVKSLNKTESAKSSRKTESGDGSKSAKTADKKGKRGKGSAEPKFSAPATPAPGGSDLPEGVVPLFLSSKTQEIFSVRADEDVTADNPTKVLTKESIQSDLFNRAAISDFHPIKAIVNSYPASEILIVYDSEFKHGQNFIVATTEEAKQLLLKQLGLLDEPEDNAIQEEVEEVYVPYTPPVAKEWLSYGSEKEIKEEIIVEHRAKIVMSVKRVRSEFGAPVSFSDRNAGDVKDGYIECAPYEDKSFDLQRMELDKGIQAIPVLSDMAMQTNWKYPKNAAVQCAPREFSDEAKAEIESSPAFAEFVNNVAPRLEQALQQNEILDVFYDDWASLSADDGSFGSKADNHLKEFQSFTDLQFSKERTITCIDWHPTAKGVVAVSVGERLSFDDRIDSASRIITTPSLILVWSFTDPIHPQLLLEAPEDILCFKFCPTDPNIIAGGCINGQIVLWDISQYSHLFKQTRSGKSKETFTLPGFEDSSSLQTPIVRYAAVSSIENSHLSPVTDLQWIPDHMELTRMGVPQENKSGQCCQILTCATDHPSLFKGTYMLKMRQEAQNRKRRTMHTMRAPVGGDGAKGGRRGEAPENLFARLARGEMDEEEYLNDEEQLDVLPGSIVVWDIRSPKLSKVPSEEKRNLTGIPTTFKHLDLTWKPHMKVTLARLDPGGDYSPTKISISEVQGDHSSLAGDDDDKTRAADTAAGEFSTGALKSGVGVPSYTKKTLKRVKTMFYAGTEDGELVYVDWMPQKDHESGKIQTPKPEFCHTLHDGPIITLQRSPFFKDVLLCIGGWTFSIWKEGVNSSPILRSVASSKRLTSGHWSPSRPSVFYITKQDGSIDIWDLLDRTHEPCMNQSISPSAITCIFPYQITSKQHLLAVGDGIGTLHILAIPWSLRQPTPNEQLAMSNYIEREVERRSFVVQRWNFREKEKMELEHEAKKKAGIAPQVILSEEELEIRMKQEYQAYLAEESNFLRQVGLLKEEEPLVAA